MWKVQGDVQKARRMRRAKGTRGKTSPHTGSKQASKQADRHAMTWILGVRDEVILQGDRPTPNPKQELIRNLDKLNKIRRMPVGLCGIIIALGQFMKSSNRYVTCCKQESH